MIARIWKGAETAVYYPEDERYVVERDLKCAHYEVEAEAPAGSDAG